MKKLINAPDAVVEEALDGMTAAHGDLIRVHRNPNFITRADAPLILETQPDKVLAAYRVQGLFHQKTLRREGRVTLHLKAKSTY
ncbi:hypothetical protein BLX87_02650 [Bacillus sp. VT-16-64]|nr:hypothetical protein BLX87_02650 [Bacillus sp. VT-16-64]